MKLSIINIVGDTNETGFLIDDNIIVVGSQADVLGVAKNTATALSLPIFEVDMDVAELVHPSEWNWDDVVASLVASSKVPVSSSKQATQIIHRDLIQDWLFSEGYSAEDIGQKNAATYVLTIERSRNSGQLWLSIVNEEIVKLGGEVSQLGMHAMIEIRDGVPAFSIGISPDENIIHVMSNNSTELAIIKELESDYPIWMPVEASDDKHNGLCFIEPENANELFNIRQVLLNNIIADYKFNERVGEPSCWEQVNEDLYSTTVYFKTETDPLTNHDIQVHFQPNGAHVMNVDYIVN